MEELRKIIATNLMHLRKSKKLTQTEIAEMFGYTDKAVSKWENGDTLPDIETLHKLCEFYNVTLDFLVHEHTYDLANKYISKMNRSVILNNSLIEVFSISCIWILATIVYVYLNIFLDIHYWEVFVWAIPATFLVSLLFIKVWKLKIYTLVAFSSFWWTLIVAIYIQFRAYNPWALFLLMIPIQVALVIGLVIKGGLKYRK